MARMVTGSVADSVAPTEMASTKFILSDSMPVKAYSHKIRPMTTADRNVPAKAKVRIGPNIAEEVGLVQLVSGGEDNRRKKQVEEDLGIEADEVSDGVIGGDQQEQTDSHAYGRHVSNASSLWDGAETRRTCEDGNDGLVDCFNLSLLQEVAGEESDDEKHDGDEQRPGGDQFLLGAIVPYVYIVSRCDHAAHRHGEARSRGSRVVPESSSSEGAAARPVRTAGQL